MSTATPFHALPRRRQAEQVLDACYFGTYEAERGNAEGALRHMHDLEDMAVEATGAVSTKAASGVAAIKARLARLDIPAALKRIATPGEMAGMLTPIAVLIAGWILGGVMA